MNFNIEITNSQQKAEWDEFIKFLCSKFKDWEYENEETEKEKDTNLQRNIG